MTEGVAEYPQTLPPNSVVGRLATTPGPTEAIPFTALAAAIAALGGPEVAGSINVTAPGFGTIGDGVTDDGPAFNAAATQAGLFSYVSAGQNWEIVVPPGKYRIATSINTPANVGWIGYGASLIGPITGFPRITGATTIPGASDVADQVGGACFTDNLGNNTLYYARFEGLDFQGFRWAFVSQCFAWYEPQIVNCNFAMCDGVALAYQGAQSWNFIDPIINNCYVGFIGAATCFASGNAYSGDDNYFADNIKISGRRANMQLVANTAFDTWFQGAILRPTTSSVVSGFSGNFALSGSPTACSPSSRLLYLPSRNSRTIFNTGIEDIIMTGSARGCAFIGRPYALKAKGIQGEGCFLDSVINQAGTTEAMITLTDSSTQITGVLENIDTEYASGGSPAGTAPTVNIITLGGTTGCLLGKSLNGPVLNAGHFAVNLANNINTTEYDTVLNSIRGLDLDAKGSESFTTVSTYYVYFMAGYSHRQKEDAFGATLPRLFAGGKLPSAAGTETNAQIVWSGSDNPDGNFFPIQGTLRVWCREMDTGVQDFYEALVTLSGRNSGTTLSGAVASGVNVIPITANEIGLCAGAVILLNGTDKYVIKSVSGLNVTLCTNTRAAYTSGETVVPIFTVDRIITAFANGICTVGASGGQSAIIVTSSLGTGVPVEWRAEFTSHGPPI